MFELTLGAKIYLLIIIIVLVIGLSIYGDTLNSIRSNQGALKGFFDPGTIFLIKNDQTWLDEKDVAVTCEGPKNNLVYTLSFDELNFYYNGLPGETKITFVPILEFGYRLAPPEHMQTIECKLDASEFDCPATSLSFRMHSNDIGERLAFSIVYFRATEGIMSKLRSLDPSETLGYQSLLNDFPDTYLSSTNVFIKDITLSRGCEEALCASYEDETTCAFQNQCYWVDRTWPLSNECRLCPEEGAACGAVEDKNACITCPGIKDRCEWKGIVIHDCEERI